MEAFTAGRSLHQVIIGHCSSVELLSGQAHAADAEKGGEGNRVQDLSVVGLHQRGQGRRSTIYAEAPDPSGPDDLGETQVIAYPARVSRG